MQKARTKAAIKNLLGELGVICPKGIWKLLNKFNYRFDAAPNFKAKIVRYIVYTLLVFLATFSFVYFIHYMGAALNIDVNTPIREQELSANLVILTLLGMLVVLTLLYAVLLRVAKAIFTKLRV